MLSFIKILAYPLIFEGFIYNDIFISDKVFKTYFTIQNLVKHHHFRNIFLIYINWILRIIKYSFLNIMSPKFTLCCSSFLQYTKKYKITFYKITILFFLNIFLSELYCVLETYSIVLVFLVSIVFTFVTKFIKTVFWQHHYLLITWLI